MEIDGSNQHQILNNDNANSMPNDDQLLLKKLPANSTFNIDHQPKKNDQINNDNNNSKLKLLEDKLRFLTLTYITIVDNAIRQIAEKKLGYNQDKEKDIFGTEYFIINFLEKEKNGQKIISNSDKIKFLCELKNQLFFPIDEDKTLNYALLTPENTSLDHDNFYVIYAHIYALRQKCVHGVCNKIPNSNFGKLLEKVLIDGERRNSNKQNPDNQNPNTQNQDSQNQDSQIQDSKISKNKNNYVSTAIHYKYLFLLMPNSFCNELINLLFNINEKDIKNESDKDEEDKKYSPYNLNKIFKYNIDEYKKELEERMQRNLRDLEKKQQELKDSENFKRKSNRKKNKSKNKQSNPLIDTRNSIEFLEKKIKTIQEKLNQINSSDEEFQRYAKKSFYREQLILKKTKIIVDDSEIFNEFKKHNLTFFNSKKVSKNYQSNRLEPRKIISSHGKNKKGENIFKPHQSNDKIYNNYRDFKFIGSDNLNKLFKEFNSEKSHLQNNCLINKIIDDYTSDKNSNRKKIQFTKKSSSLKKLAFPQTKLSFEELVHIFKFLANLNSLFRQHFTNIYNYWDDKDEDTKKEIRDFNNLKFDGYFIKKLEKIIDEIDKNPIENLKINYLNNLVEVINLKNPKKNPNQNEKIFIQNLEDIKLEIKRKINLLKNNDVSENHKSNDLKTLRNNIEHSNLLGIFQDVNKLNFSLKNFNKNLCIVKEFLDKHYFNKYPKQSCDKSCKIELIPLSDFLTFKNHLKQLFEKQDQQKFVITENKEINNNQNNLEKSNQKFNNSADQENNPINANQSVASSQMPGKITNNVIIKNAVLLSKNKKRMFKKSIETQLEIVKNPENLSIIKFNYYDRFKAILKDDLITNFPKDKKKIKKNFKKILI